MWYAAPVSAAGPLPNPDPPRHSAVVRVTHWITVIAFLALLLSGLYWIETLLARQARLRRALLEDGGTAQSTLPAARMFRASMEGCAYYWGFIGVVAALFWVLFYVL